MLKIYGVPISVHTRKAIVVANLKDLPYELVPVVPVIPGNPPPDWRELSLTGRIPAMRDGDFTVADSTAICTYLDRAYPAAPVYPANARHLAQVLALEAYAGEQMFGRVVRPLFHEVFVHPNIRNQPADQAVIDQVLAREVPEAFGTLERQATAEYLVGDGLSMADIAVTSNLLTFQYCGFELDRRSYPRLAALFDRVVMHPAVRRALEGEAPVVKSMGLCGDCLRPLLN